MQASAAASSLCGALPPPCVRLLDTAVPPIRGSHLIGAGSCPFIVVWLRTRTATRIASFSDSAGMCHGVPNKKRVPTAKLGVSDGAMLSLTYSSHVS